jgi:hypothetical protein
MIKFHEKVGPKTIQLCFVFDGWIVGGSTDFLSGLSDIKPKDIDIVIPHDKWGQASKLLFGATANSFGGFKIKDGEYEIDVWMDDVARLFTQNGENFKAYQPKYNITIEKVKHKLTDKTAKRKLTDVFFSKEHVEDDFLKGRVFDEYTNGLFNSPMS